MPRAVKLGRPPRTPTETYLLEIEQWNWAYSFGVPDPFYREKHGGEVFEEFSHLVINGSMHRPRKLLGKRAEATVFGSPGLDRAKWKDLDPRAVGSIDTFLQSGINVNIMVRIPDEKMPSCLTMLTAGQWRWISFSCTPMEQRRAAIRRFSFEHTWHFEDEG